MSPSGSARPRWSALLVVGVASAVALSVVACGPKKAPEVPTGEAASAPALQQVSPSTGTIAAGDEPTDGNTADRTEMNASARAAYDRGLAAWSAGDLNGAKTGFIEATQADPKAYQAHFSLGTVLERLGDPAALNAYRESFTALNSYEPAIVAYAQLLAKKGSLSDADDFLTDKKQRMPRSAAVLTALAEVKSLKRDTGSAQQLAQDALKLKPNYSPAMVVLARDHYRNRRLDLALYALDAILGTGDPDRDAKNPPREKNNAEAQLLKAVILKEQGKRSQALAAFEKAIAQRPDLVDARVQYAAYLLESGNADKAKPQLDEALKYNKDHLAAHLNRGDALRLLGDSENAKKEFDWVVAKDSSLPQVHYSLGLLFLFTETMAGMDKKQQYEASISEFEKFQQLRGKPSAGNADDSDQLLSRAKNKIEELNGATRAQAEAAAAAAAASAAAASASAAARAAPPASGSAAPADPPAP
jgi:tetratricopeptide (TPR) repeat protein